MVVFYAHNHPLLIVANGTNDSTGMRDLKIGVSKGEKKIPAMMRLLYVSMLSCYRYGNIFSFVLLPLENGYPVTRQLTNPKIHHREVGYHVSEN